MKDDCGNSKHQDSISHKGHKLYKFHSGHVHCYTCDVCLDDKMKPEEGS